MMANELLFRKTGGSGNPTFSWSGYHDTSVSNWNFTSTVAFADPASNSNNGNAIVERDNNGFGTVSSYVSGARKLPGIVFTPPIIGRYRASAVVTFVSAPSANHYIILRLTDGTNIVAETGSLAGTGAGTFALTLTGILPVASITSTTLRIQGIVDTGTGIITTAAVEQAMISWSIEAI